MLPKVVIKIFIVCLQIIIICQIDTCQVVFSGCKNDCFSRAVSSNDILLTKQNQSNDMALPTIWLSLLLTALLLHLTQAIIKDCDYQQINQLLKDAPSGYDSDMSCLEDRRKMAVRNLEP